MKKLLVSLLFLLPTVVLIAQKGKHISWIEDNLKDKLQLGADSTKVYSIEDRMATYKVPGMSLAVVRNGKIVWAKGYGVANSITRTSVDEHTLFQAGSISKPVAALAILKLVQQGKVDLDTDVNTYLKEWKIPKSKYTKTEKVTLRRILTHTAGLNVHGFPGYALEKRVPSTIEVLNGKGNTPKIKVIAKPGEKWKYSGGGFTIMQLVVKDVSGMALPQFMDEFIFPEVGMTESTYTHPLVAGKTKIASAAYDRKGVIYTSKWMNYPESAAAGLWTTPSDLAKFCLFLQNSKKRKEGSISQVLIDDMLKPGKGNWGLGISIADEGDEKRFSHGGKNAGFTNDFFGFVKKGDALIVLTNGDNGWSLIQDVEYAVSEFYNWNVYKYTVISANPVQLSAEQLTKLEGSYLLKMDGRKAKIKAEAVNGRLVLSSKKLPGKLNLTAISPTSFVEADRGMRIEFTLTPEGEVSHFLFNGRGKAEKL